MSFGLSGSPTAVAMINADVVVVDYRDDRAPRAIDYFLTDYSQVPVTSLAISWIMVCPILLCNIIEQESLA